VGVQVTSWPTPGLHVRIALFAFASLLGGFAQSQAWLLASGVAGVGGAIASPTALALITTNFDEGPERNRAFGVPRRGLECGSGGRSDRRRHADVVVVLALDAVRQRPDRRRADLRHTTLHQESERNPGRFDLAGALTSTLGMVTLVWVHPRRG
jgi:hypothetical protein